MHGAACALCVSGSGVCMLFVCMGLSVAVTGVDDCCAGWDAAFACAGGVLGYRADRAIRTS